MGGAEALAGLVAEELAQPVPEAASRLAEAIRGRTGPATAAILFYGSCLRKRSAEGVLDFYVLVDAYRAANPGRRLALANALLPPNVFYLELAAAGGVLRAKYAVVTLEDFAHGAAGRWLRTGIWARFSQPVRAVYLRDTAAEQAVVAACAESVLTLLERALPMLPGEGDRIRAGAADLWQTAFSETYAAEMRPEQPEAIAGLFQDQPERYAGGPSSPLEPKRAPVALARGDRWKSAAPGEALMTARRANPDIVRKLATWRSCSRPLTFGDWLPYAPGSSATRRPAS
jgi:hypothetical protein